MRASACRVLVLMGLTLHAAAAQEAARQVRLGAARQEAGAWIAPMHIDAMGGVLAMDIEVVLDRRRVSIEDVRPTDLLAGFLVVHNVVVDTLKIAVASARAGEGSGVFAEIVARSEGPPDLRFSLVSLNGDGLEVEYEPRYLEPAPGDSTAVREERAPPPGAELRQNYPNPFNAATRIDWVLSEAALVRLAIYNAAGQRLRVLVEGVRPAGEQRALWDGRDGEGRAVGSGVYFYRLEAGKVQKVRGMALLR